MPQDGGDVVLNGPGANAMARRELAMPQPECVSGEGGCGRGLKPVWRATHDTRFALPVCLMVPTALCSTRLLARLHWR